MASALTGFNGAAPIKARKCGGVYEWWIKSPWLQWGRTN